MPLSDYLLYRIAKPWPNPAAHFTKQFGAEPGTDQYEAAYAVSQFERRVKQGIGAAVTDCDVLEIGSGHGGISCFLALVGAKKVVGVDLNEISMKYAYQLAERLARPFGPEAKLPVEFHLMDASKLDLPDESFDVVVSENTFEHFTDPEQVLRESYRVLRPNGRVVVPIFSSIYSRFGLHLKHGLKLPWANLFFSEKTIIKAMHRMAADRPELHELYPGLSKNPQRVRDLRRHGDLNDITYKRFQKMAGNVGFKVESFRPLPTSVGTVLQYVPGFRRSILGDVFSTGARTLLRK